MDNTFYTKQNLLTCSIEKSSKHSLVQNKQQEDQKACKICSSLTEETPERCYILLSLSIWLTLGVLINPGLIFRMWSFIIENQLTLVHRCSIRMLFKKCRKINKETLVLESLSDKVVNFKKFFRIILFTDHLQFYFYTSFDCCRDNVHAPEKDKMRNFLFVSLEKHIDKTVLTRKIWYLPAEET